MGTVTDIRSNPEQEGGNNKIVRFFHCALCIEELPEDMSPSEYQITEAGWTIEGFQVWCLRHDANIIHMDFEGQKHRTI